MLQNEFDQKLALWRDYVQQLDALKAREMELRKELFSQAFEAPKEGTNTLDLQAGWKLKGVYKINRKIDEAAIPAVREELKKIEVSIDPLLRWSADLVTANYKALSDATRSVFDKVLIITPGSPSLELVEPKAKK